MSFSPPPRRQVDIGFKARFQILEAKLPDEVLRCLSGRLRKLGENPAADNTSADRTDGGPFGRYSFCECRDKAGSLYGLRFLWSWSETESVDVHEMDILRRP